MTYLELIDNIAESRGVSRKEAREIVEGIFNTLRIELGKDKGVSIPGLGTFTTKTREPRKVYSPHHEKYMKVPPKRVVEFSPSASLKENLKFKEPVNE